MKPTLSKSELVYLVVVIGLCFVFSITNDPVWQTVILMTVLNLTIAGVFIAAIRLRRLKETQTE